ncbi:MAG: hypothetical protein IPI11_13980 [Haliscomenobacter sp.]|nr:hypothetical protein [Haliscomenobacter sp.]
MIERLLRKHLEDRWNSGKAIIIPGPRQVGRTTLWRQICSERGNYVFLNADEVEVFPSPFSNAYHPVSMAVVHRDNFEDFLLE